MSSQNDMLKKDILQVLSKEISGGGDVRTAYPNSNVPKTDFGLAGSVEPEKSGTTWDGHKWKRDQVFKYTPSEGGFVTYIIIKNGKVVTDDGKPPKMEIKKYDPSVGKDKFYDSNIRTYGDINVESGMSFSMDDKKNMEDFIKFANRMAKKPAKS